MVPANKETATSPIMGNLSCVSDGKVGTPMQAITAKSKTSAKTKRCMVSNTPLLLTGSSKRAATTAANPVKTPPKKTDEQASSDLIEPDERKTTKATRAETLREKATSPFKRKDAPKTSACTEKIIE